MILIANMICDCRNAVIQPGVSEKQKWTCRTKVIKEFRKPVRKKRVEE